MPHLAEKKVPRGMDEADAQCIWDYVSWLPMNPEVNSVARLHLKHGMAGSLCCIADAPMCCSRNLFLSHTKPISIISNPIVRGRNRSSGDAGDESIFRNVYINGSNGDGNVQEDEALQGVDMSRYVDVLSAQLSNDRLDKAKLLIKKAVYVDKHVLLHRLYVGIDSQFGTASTLHKLLSDFLPATRYILHQIYVTEFALSNSCTDIVFANVLCKCDKSNHAYPESHAHECRYALSKPVAREEAEMQEINSWLDAVMQLSSAAEEMAVRNGMPSFHWARVYRM